MDALVELAPAHDAEVFVEQSPMQALDETVGLGVPYLGATVPDTVEVQVELVPQNSLP